MVSSPHSAPDTAGRAMGNMIDVERAGGNPGRT